MTIKKYILFRGVVVLGGLFLIVGLLFNQRGWPDAFYGLYSGPTLIVIGLLLELFSEDKSIMNTNQNLLSSRATYFYRFVLPLLGGVALIIFFVIVLTNNIMLDFLIPLGVFFAFLWGIVFFIGISVNYIYFNSEGFTIKNKDIMIPLEEVVEIDRFFYNFYVLKCRNGKKYFFIPHISEVFQNPFSDPESIKRAKRLISVPNK